MTPRTSTKANPADQPSRQRILQAATELFAAKGYDATGVQEISEAADLGRGALYYHINSKQDLLFDIMMTAVEVLTEGAREVAARDISAEEKLRELARALLNRLAHNPASATVSASETRALSKAQRKRLLKARGEYEKVWYDAFTEAEKAGLIRPVQSVIVRGVLGMLSNTYLWIRESGPETPESVADLYVDMVLDGLRPK